MDALPEFKTVAEVVNFFTDLDPAKEVLNPHHEKNPSVEDICAEHPTGVNVYTMKTVDDILRVLALRWHTYQIAGTNGPGTVPIIDGKLESPVILMVNVDRKRGPLYRFASEIGQLNWDKYLR